MAWKLSAFGDEISDDLHEQLETLRGLGIGYLELRGVWGKNVLHLSNEEVVSVGVACAERGMAVSAIGSPVGKSPITQPLAQEMANLERIFAIAHALDTTLVRVFSFYPPAASETQWTEAALVEEAVARLSAMTDAAERAGMQLVLENEHGIVGDTVARCQTLLHAVPSSRLAFAWDPANFVHVGEATSVSDGWDALGPRTRHVHIKDYRLADQKVLPAGEGDGQIEQLLSNLVRAEYDGFLALEPHLSYAGRSTGFSGPEGMGRAATALRALMQRVGITETKPTWQSGAQ
jgi:sugar phosphate isomerase/epimerase